MPEFTHQSDKSESNPQPITGVDALAKLSPPQADSLILRVVSELAKQVQKLDNRMRYLEKYETNPHPPVRTVTGDSEFIKVSQNEEHVIVSFDEEELRRHFPPPLFPDYIDQYRHCDDSAVNADIYLPSGIADANLDPDGTLVVKVTLADEAEKCYYLWERNVLDALTPYTSVVKVVDCSECTDVPTPHPDPDPDPDPDGDYSTFNGVVVHDFNCTKDDAGDLVIMVRFVDLNTGEITEEKRLDCCCGAAPSPFYLDRWRPCDADSGDDSADVFLYTAIYEFADGADPIIQIDETGPCYRFVEEVTGETVTDFDQILHMDTCDDEECDPYSTPPNVCGSDVTRLRIQGYTDGLFGQIQRNNIDGGPVESCADCGSFSGNGDTTAGCVTWDGTMPSIGAGTWYVVAANTLFTSKMMKISASQNTAIRNDTGVDNTIPGFYTFTIRFQCANTSVLTYRRVDTTGPCGVYELYSTSVSSDTTACGSPWPTSITIETY